MFSSPYQALGYLEAAFPGTVLAGGFLRDFVFKAPIKDADFFMPFGVELEELKKTFPDARPEPFSKFLEYSTGEVAKVFDLGAAQDGIPMQAIVLREGIVPRDRVELFDFGFCQIGMSVAAGGAFYSDAFLKDKADNTATLTHAESKEEFDRSMRRWKRLSAKYPDRKLVIPEEFRQWM